jgi:RNA polymerase sigma-70 factor (ECF subfamily)
MGTPPDAIVPQLAQIIDRLQWSVYGFVCHLLNDGDQAHDVVQDVFCDVWRQMQRRAPPFGLNGDDAAMRRWIFHAAYCRAVSLLRRRRAIAWESIEAARAVALESPMSFEDQLIEGESLRTALRTLAPEDAACVLLSVVQGWNAVEIAQIIGISHEAAKKRIARAKQRLRSTYLAQEEG